MPTSPQVRVYLGCSLDGYIAGPDTDLDWLTAPRDLPGDLPPDGGALDFMGFMGQVGCMLMGRTTYDFVASFDAWPYGDVPVLVATRRPLEPAAPTVSRVEGDIGELLAQAKARAGERDVYLDGGALVQQALNAGLVDELTLTYVPILLGDGVRLFDKLGGRTTLQFFAHHPMENGLLQVRARVLRA